MIEGIMHDLKENWSNTGHDDAEIVQLLFLGGLIDEIRVQNTHLERIAHWLDDLGSTLGDVRDNTKELKDMSDTLAQLRDNVSAWMEDK